MTFLFSASRSFAATTHDVYIGGVTSGAPLAPGGVVWFNGYSPGTIRITAGDTVTWHLVCRLLLEKKKSSHREPTIPPRLSPASSSSACLSHRCPSTVTIAEGGIGR